MAKDAQGFTRRGALGLTATATTALALPAAAQRPAKPNPRELWYTAPATKWTEALPVGNGRLGAMVFGGTASERLQLNEDTIWAGTAQDPVNPRAKAALPKVRELIFAGKYAEAEKLASADVMAIPLKQPPYQTAGSLMIDMAGADTQVTGYRRSLDLGTAVAETRWTAGGVAYRRRAIASPVDQVIAVRIEADRPGAIAARLGFTCPLKTWRVAAEGADTLVLSGTGDPHDGRPGAIRFEARLHMLNEGGRVEAAGDALMLSGANAVTLLIAIATNFRRFDDLMADPTALTKARIASAAAKPFAAIERASITEHRRLFDRVRLDLGDAPDLPTDKRIEAMRTGDDPALAALYFDYARYLLIGSSRPGTQPANLQGIWNDLPTPPWESKYTVNINTEMNYWPAEPAGLPELTEPLIRMVEELSVTGARTAREMYGARGWVCHHNTDIWRASAPIDGPQWGLWPTGGAWLSMHLWYRWEYGQDRAYLARVYPVMHGAALFFLDTLQRDPKSGHLVTNPSMSPENQHPFGGTVCAGPAMDNQLLRDLFDHVGEAARLLGREDESTVAMAAARARLLPDKVGKAGQLQEWAEDWDMEVPEPKHRHHSHLYALYPSHQIAPDTTPALAAAAKRTLELRGDEATGWATAWRINLWARLRDGDHAHRILRFLLGPERTYPNLFDAHPPFQIDGNFGGASGMLEMLVQDRGDTLFLLPALPSAWPQGSVAGVRLKGRGMLDLTWRGGRLASALLRSEVAGERRVMLDDKAKTVRLTPGRAVRLTARDFA
ncbi:glycoside hydrolase family 95 protein [uncultured Sphingomonas sp.]|uniref:glycoside hydrolase family 95 protein n=1 Tax=uncultured Sphingomonas sp. TaxID=158754 RepID=UPI0025E369FA|nr:glycoside hydrolase family 95 protein [uncultured Sphingomonas sp.]